MSNLNIAYFDVENSPNLGWYYDPWKENNIIATEQPWFMLSFAWKKPKKDKIYCRALPDYPGYNRNKTNDKKLICDLWELFNSYDVLVGHNIARFDTRKANSRFIFHGLKPPSPYIILDSLSEWKKITHQDRYGLDALSRFKGFGGKLPTTGWDMHQGAINGHMPSWRMMKNYNRVDVEKAEQIWNVIAPWKKTYGRSTGRICPNPICGSLDIIMRGPVRQTTKHNFTCKTCGHWWTAIPGMSNEHTSRRCSRM